MKISEQRRCGGFTLLEMMVVMLIAGMALTLATQALDQYQHANARVAANTQAGRQYRLAEAWFRDSVRGLVAVESQALPTAARDSSSGPAVSFEGRQDGFHGLTLAPVLAGQGVPTPQRWQVVRDAAGGEVLELEEGGQRLQLRMAGTSRLLLGYLDPGGELHAQWPPTQGAWPQLPAAVVLESSSGEGPTLLVVATVIGPHDPVSMPYEPEPF